MKLREKTTATLLIAIFMMSTLALIIPVMAKKGGTTIQDGTLTYSAGHYLAGQPLKVGYDIFGYNYQAHLYNGYYCNVYLGRAGFSPYEGDSEAYLAENPDAEDHWTWPYRDIRLNMKWNDAWLSNMDRGYYDTEEEEWVLEPDGILDRWYGYDSYIGSGAWETNHQWGVDDGSHWSYFVKIVAVPVDAYPEGGVWYQADSTEIGSVIWGSFAIIQQIEQGVEYNSPSPVGFGYYQP